MDTLRTLLRNQFEAALSTLGLCIEGCPRTDWDAPVVNEPVCRVVFHTLFFTDLYLSPDEASFREQCFHRDNADLFGDYEQLQWCEPTSLYDRAPLQEYLAFCRNKVVAVLDAETDESLAGPSGFPRREFTRAELHVYSIRHIQHHAAQLSMRLRLSHQIDIPWVGSGWHADQS